MAYSYAQPTIPPEDRYFLLNSGKQCFSPSAFNVTSDVTLEKCKEMCNEEYPTCNLLTYRTPSSQCFLFTECQAPGDIAGFDMYILTTRMPTASPTPTPTIPLEDRYFLPFEGFGCTSPPFFLVRPNTTLDECKAECNSLYPECNFLSQDTRTNNCFFRKECFTPSPLENFNLYTITTRRPTASPTISPTKSPTISSQFSCLDCQNNSTCLVDEQRCQCSYPYFGSLCENERDCTCV